MAERDPRDVGDVIREERSRGRRPIDTDAIRERQELLGQIQRLIEAGKKETLLRLVAERARVPRDSPEYREILALLDAVLPPRARP